MAYVPTQDEIDEVKKINGWKGIEHDEYINTMLPILYEHIPVTCNNDFIDTETGLVKFPGGVRLFVAKAIEHNMQKSGLKSKSMGSVSYSYDLDFPSSPITYLRPYRRLKFHASR